MRYIAIDDSLVLLAASGKPKYEFKNGVLQVGTATGTGAGNEIVPDLSGTNLDSQMATLYPTAGTDLGKVGLDQIFFAAPPIAANGTNQLAANSYYELLSGSPNLSAGTYPANITLVEPGVLTAGDLQAAYPGIIIKTGGSAFAPPSAAGVTWALALPIRLQDPKHLNERSENFQINNLSAYKDESSYDNAAMTSRTKDPKYVR